VRTCQKQIEGTGRTITLSTDRNRGSVDRFKSRCSFAKRSPSAKRERELNDKAQCQGDDEPNRKKAQPGLDRKYLRRLDGRPFVNVGTVFRQIGTQTEEVAAAAVPHESG
jgi:hypothetical protein